MKLFPDVILVPSHEQMSTCCSLRVISIPALPSVCGLLASFVRLVVFDSIQKGVYVLADSGTGSTLTSSITST